MAIEIITLFVQLHLWVILGNWFGDRFGDVLYTPGCSLSVHLQNSSCWIWQHCHPQTSGLILQVLFHCCCWLLFILQDHLLNLAQSFFLMCPLLMRSSSSVLLFNDGWKSAVRCISATYWIGMWKTTVMHLPMYLYELFVISCILVHLNSWCDYGSMRKMNDRPRLHFTTSSRGSAPDHIFGCKKDFKKYVYLVTQLW